MTTRRIIVPAAILVVGFAILGSVLGAGRSAPGTAGPPLPAPAWAQGQAELCRYELRQNRYGQIREGDSIMVFVEEDFLPKTQVKAEMSVPGEAPVKVLKLNEMRRFQTGVYDYSLMRSVFTPREHPGATGRTLKITSSSQDWCGQSWTQLNRMQEGLRLRGYSYFQGEADEDRALEAAFTEDGVWTLVRLDPGALPVGRIEMVPGLFHHRLDHTELRPEPAQAELTDAVDGRRTYRVAYDSGRTLEIEFDATAPYRIQSFRELQRRSVIAEGTLTNVMSLPYWNHGRLSDDDLRRELGLE